MLREAAIMLYLLVFRVFFSIFQLYPQQAKTTFVASFGDNVLFTLNALEKQVNHSIVILKTSQCKMDFERRCDCLVLAFDPKNVIDWFRSIYHLATSTHVFVDNYFGFLAAARFKPNVVCIQLWHAAGAIKRFGLKDPSIQNRSPRALKRFIKVYSRFDYVVVGSRKMADIFHESFGIETEKMLRTGIPRTDFFFHKKDMEKAADLLKTKIPIIHGKKVLLYAPTYRDNDIHNSRLKLNIDRMYQELNEDYVLLLRLHPAIQTTFCHMYPDFICDVSGYSEVNPLLVITEILITDYSSIPFEFSLLHKPMIFFAYDLDVYASSRGFWEPYEQLVPGPIVKNTEELIKEIHKNHEEYLERVQTFANDWNEYSRGNSSDRLIKYLY